MSENTCLEIEWDRAIETVQACAMTGVVVCICIFIVLHKSHWKYDDVGYECCFVYDSLCWWEKMSRVEVELLSTTAILPSLSRHTDRSSPHSRPASGLNLLSLPSSLTTAISHPPSPLPSPPPHCIHGTCRRRQSNQLSLMWLQTVPDLAAVWAKDDCWMVTAVIGPLLQEEVAWCS